MATLEDVLEELGISLERLREFPGAEEEIQRLLDEGLSAEEIAEAIRKLFPDLRPTRTPGLKPPGM